MINPRNRVSRARVPKQSLGTRVNEGKSASGAASAARWCQHWAADAAPLAYGTQWLETGQESRDLERVDAELVFVRRRHIFALRYLRYLTARSRPSQSSRPRGENPQRRLRITLCGVARPRSGTGHAPRRLVLRVPRPGHSAWHLRPVESHVGVPPR